MAQIRRELHSDVREVVASAEAVTDWRRYIRNAPWVALGASFAIGYILVPRRHKASPPSVVAVVPTDAAQVREAVSEVKAKSPRKGLLGMAFGLLGPIAVRAAQGYALQYLEQYLAQQQGHVAGPVPPTAPGAEPRSGRAAK